MPPKRKKAPGSSEPSSVTKKAKLSEKGSAGTQDIDTPSKRSTRTPRKTSRRQAAQRDEEEVQSEGNDVSASDVEEDPTQIKERKPRAKRLKRKRTPTPPPDMPAYEHYFFQNRPGASNKTSTNTLSSLSLLTHEEFFNIMRKHVDPHQDEMDYLHHLHSRSFEQWLFELEEGFSLCLFGWGSKKILLSAFAEHVATHPDVVHAKVLIANGYHPSTTIRDILIALASQIQSLKTAKLGSQPADALTLVLSALSEQQNHFYLLLHSIDGPNLRRMATQALLAKLAAHPKVHLVASADTPSFALLWDAAIRTKFNFLFHDATTFQPFEAEIGAAAAGGGVVDEVNSLLGRSGRRVHGREGVGFVLRSLTESARRLYGLLLSEVLSADVDPAAGAAAAEAKENEFEQALGGGGGGGSAASGELGGVEYRSLYRKAVQALITGSEMSFRQLLKEFLDHQMVTSRRDGMGMEILSVPFRRDECEAILEDLVVDE